MKAFICSLHSVGTVTDTLEPHANHDRISLGSASSRCTLLAAYRWIWVKRT